MNRATNRAATVINLVALANFFVFVVIALCIGGSAIGGKIENGKYYVFSHGRYTEVSPATFEYSQIHTYSVFATVPLAIFISVKHYLAERSKWMP
jgi:hypothetical protein